AADGRGELAQAGLGQLFRRQRLVGGAEVDGAGLDLGDPAAGADRLVVDLVAGGGVVVGRPARHQRVDERGAGTGDLRGHRFAAAGRGLTGGAVGVGRSIAITAGGQRQRRGQGQDEEAGREARHWAGPVFVPAGRRMRTSNDVFVTPV